MYNDDITVILHLGYFLPEFFTVLGMSVFVNYPMASMIMPFINTWHIFKNNKKYMEAETRVNESPTQFKSIVIKKL